MRNDAFKGLQSAPNAIDEHRASACCCCVARSSADLSRYPLLPSFTSHKDTVSLRVFCGSFYWFLCKRQGRIVSHKPFIESSFHLLFEGKRHSHALIHGRHSNFPWGFDRAAGAPGYDYPFDSGKGIFDEVSIVHEVATDAETLCV